MKILCRIAKERMRIQENVIAQRRRIVQRKEFDHFLHGWLSASLFSLSGIRTAQDSCTGRHRA